MESAHTLHPLNMTLRMTIVFLFLTVTVLANDIDKLQTNEDVQRFLVKKVNKWFKDDSPFEGVKLRYNGPEPRNTFYKVDLNKDGRTDLVIDGISALVIVMDKGGLGKRELWLLDDTSFGTTALIGIDSLANPAKVIVQRNINAQKIDSLVYVYGNFVEYNPNPIESLKFESIKFTTSSCLGLCPAFELTIDRNGHATYNAIRFNPERGVFTGTLSPTQLYKLKRLLGYIQVEKLADRYQVNWTDDQTVTLEVKTNEYHKTIEDYGRLGSFGLTALYYNLFQLRDQVDWEE